MLPDDIEEAHKMIEDLRKENADRRVKAKKYDDAFSKFNETEREYLVDLVSRTGDDPKEGAKGFRDLAFRVLDNDPAQFLDGLDIELPTAEPAKEETTTEESTEESPQMTPEQMQKILDERDTKAKAEAEAAAQKEAEEAEIESVFAEIEALGFERDTPAFLAILNMGGAMAASGEFEGFEGIAPKVKMAFDMNDTVEEPAAETEPEVEGSGKAHVSTAEAGGSAGAPAEPEKDWVQAAKDAGIPVMQAARERAESRIYD